MNDFSVRVIQVGTSLVLCSIYLVLTPVNNYLVILHVNRSQWRPGPKAWVCGRSFAGTVGSNPAGGHGCLSLVIVVYCQVETSASG